MSWVDGRLHAFDLETTAPDPRRARIVTAHVASVNGGQETVTRDWTAAVDVPIPDGAAEVHGYSTERARAEGRPPEVVLAELLDALAELPEEEPLIGFNVRYDMTVADREAKRYGLTPLTERRKVYTVCPLVIDRHVQRFRAGSRKLVDTAEFYWQRPLGETAHTASADALAAARCAWVIGKHGWVKRRASDWRGVPRDRLPAWKLRELEELEFIEAEWEQVRHDLPELFAAQQRWAQFQLDEFGKYLASKGAEPEKIEGVRSERGWPVMEEQPGGLLCERVLVGQGGVTSDPVCWLDPGHEGACAPACSAMPA